MRFDEVELEAVPLGIEEIEPIERKSSPATASVWRRLLAVITDLSLFAALALALSPLLPQSFALAATASLAGFVVVLSYYYFVGAWMLWGKTIGGAIFDVRTAAMTLRDASARWAALIVPLAACGVVIALLW